MRCFLSFGIVFSLLSPLIANAALPPLSQAERLSQSSDIVVGRVKLVLSFEHPKDENFSDTIYSAGLLITDVEKGDLKVDEPVVFSYWKQKERPSGWCGPGGQYGRVETHSIIRVYLTKDESGYKLIEPNGVDVLNR